MVQHGGYERGREREEERDKREREREREREVERERERERKGATERRTPYPPCTAQANREQLERI